MALMFQPLRKYATFKGRARRAEYWLWQVFLGLLFTLLTMWLFATMDKTVVQSLQSGEITVTEFAGLPGSTLVWWLISLASIATILPSLAVSVRRLHDIDRSGWWVLIGITGIGSLILLLFFLLDGSVGPNRYGPDPKGRSLG